MSDLTLVSLFDGIGGFPLAFERAGATTVATVEIDTAAAAISKRHFPHAHQFDDVTKVTGNDLRAVGFVPERGILTAGWPCQDLSVAGRRAGLDGARSGLWWEVVRLLDELHPRWFVGENVPGLLSSNNGEDFGAVLGSLGELGYGIAYRILDAQHFGVPQQRRRVVIVGHLGAPFGAAAQVLLEPESGSGDSSPGRQAREGATSGTDGGVYAAGRDVAPALVARYAKGTDSDATDALIIDQPLALRGREDGAEVELAAEGSPSHALRTPGGGSSHAMVCVTGEVTHTLTSEGHDASEDGTGRGTPIVVHPPFTTSREVAQSLTANYGKQADNSDTNLGPTLAHTETIVRRLTPTECERLQGYPDNWTAGQSGAARYRQLGNSVAVPCVEWIARRLVAVDEELT